MEITNPADCEVLSVIQFLNAKNIRLAEIQCQLVKVYGEGVMNKGNVSGVIYLMGKDRCT
jgi:hypothetical protein